MLSLIKTANVTIIEKLYFYEPHETIESIKSVLFSLIEENGTFPTGGNIVDWLIDNVELDSDILNYLFELTIRSNFAHRSVTDNLLTSKLISMGVCSEKTDELLYLSSDNFFDYISRNNYEVNAYNTKYLFHFIVDEKVHDYLYNLLMQSELLMIDIYVILVGTFKCMYLIHSNNLKKFLEMVSQKNNFKELIYCVAYSCYNIIPYIAEYDFCDEIIFLQKVLCHAARTTRMPDGKLDDYFLLIINSNKEAARLYKLVTSHFIIKPTDINNEEIMRDVISLKNIFEKDQN